MHALVKPQRLAARPAGKARLPLARRDVDHMHRAVALAADEQFVLAVDHVHRLVADLDRGLGAERPIDQADDVAVRTGDGDGRDR